MVIVIARIVVRPGAKPDFLAAARECIAATRKEAGNIGYSAFEDVTDDNGIVFVEEWRDQAAVAQHMGQPHTQKLLGAAPQWLAAPPSITMHEVAVSTALV